VFRATVTQLLATGFYIKMFSANRAALFTSIFLASFPTYSCQQASAATFAAEQATEMLARAHAVQQKCKFLTANQNEELSRFVARAEIAMVSKSSTKATKAIIANGRAQGQKAACSDTERTDILDILNAAQQASAGSRPPAAKPVAIEKPRLSLVAVKKTAPDAVQKSALTGNLGEYAILTKRYYLARRCNSMSMSSINSLYRNVVATHRKVVSNFGVPAVRNIMQQSEQRASQSSCG
jgi:hypothetical protein